MRTRVEEVSNEESAPSAADEKRLKMQIWLAFAGFAISVFVILCGLLVLVRFWVFTNILYNLFVASILIVGVLFNITSINLCLIEVDSISYLNPFIYGFIVSIFWNALGLFLQVCQSGFFLPFSKVPYVHYSDSFYSGESYDENVEKSHPFLVKFNQSSGIFHYPTLILCLLLAMLIVQMIFYFFLLKFHRSVKLAFNDMNEKLENLKEL